MWKHTPAWSGREVPRGCRKGQGTETQCLSLEESEPSLKVEQEPGKAGKGCARHKAEQGWGPLAIARAAPGALAPLPPWAAQSGFWLEKAGGVGLTGRGRQVCLCSSSLRTHFREAFCPSCCFGVCLPSVPSLGAGCETMALSAPFHPHP